MAKIKITLDESELPALLAQGNTALMKVLFERALNEVMKVQSDEQINAKRYARTEERTDYRNGFRDRELTTRIGTITLHVPRHRLQPFHTEIFESYSRSEAGLIAVMMEMVICGVSTRKVSKVVEALCGESISKSAVSSICERLDDDVDAFKNRPLTESYPFLTVDATYFRVRENHRSVSKALFIAYGTNTQGHREIIGFEIYDKESADTWNEFFLSLKQRGLHGVTMITSDAHGGILSAIVKQYPDVPWQRCQFHFSKNITDKAPMKYQAGLRAELNEMFNCSSVEEARRKRDEIIKDYSDVAERAVQILDEGFESAMTAMILPPNLRKYFRTSNHIERLNRELKRRSNVIGVFPNEKSLLRLMGSLLIELNEQNPQKRAIFSPHTLQEVMKPERLEKLKAVAREQSMLVA